MCRLQGRFVSSSAGFSYSFDTYKRAVKCKVRSSSTSAKSISTMLLVQGCEVQCHFHVALPLSVLLSCGNMLRTAMLVVAVRKFYIWNFCKGSSRASAHTPLPSGKPIFSLFIYSLLRLRLPVFISRYIALQIIAVMSPCAEGKIICKIFISNN